MPNLEHTGIRTRFTPGESKYIRPDGSIGTELRSSIRGEVRYDSPPATRAAARQLYTHIHVLNSFRGPCSQFPTLGSKDTHARKQLALTSKRNPPAGAGANTTTMSAAGSTVLGGQMSYKHFKSMMLA